MTNNNGTYGRNGGVAELSGISKEELDEICEPAHHATTAFAGKAQQHIGKADEIYQKMDVGTGLKAFVITYITDPIGLSSPAKRWKARDDVFAKHIYETEVLIERGEKGLENLFARGNAIHEKVRKADGAYIAFEREHQNAADEQAKWQKEYQELSAQLETLPETAENYQAMHERVRGIENELVRVGSRMQQIVRNWDRTRYALQGHVNAMKMNERRQHEQEIALMQLSNYRNVLESAKNKLAPYVTPGEGIAESDVVGTINRGQSALAGLNAELKQAIGEIEKNKTAAMAEIDKIDLDCTAEEDTFNAKLRLQANELRQKAVMRITKTRKELRRF